MTSLKEVKETGEYVGAKGESSSEDDDGPNNSDDEVAYVQQSSDEAPSDADNSTSATAKPLFFAYDCESTAADIYKDHITEIAATVVVPETMDVQAVEINLEFQSLVSTSRRIIPAGTCIRHDHNSGPL